jgi:hypothetical protein
MLQTFVSNNKKDEMMGIGNTIIVVVLIRIWKFQYEGWL